MNYNQLVEQIKQKESFLCVGLDTDINKIPEFLKILNDPIFAFNKGIVEATAEYSIAYKINVAFYEALGKKGWESLEKTAWHIKNNYPNIFLIADAKRGDIGNTSAQYAKAFFHTLPFDAVTVAPYMGSDSVKPFLEYENKFVILLALTSNEGAADFQYFENNEFEFLFEKVIKVSQQWADKEKMMYVVGATRAEMLEQIRKLVPDHFLLIPGVGAQGGSLEEVAKYGLNANGGLIVNLSRNIIYAGNQEDFREQSAAVAKLIQMKMRTLLENHRII
ncbi:MAG: orotidine-5'-phosphate decarboxylase [Bacteroidales bacterium]|nr:orotidine-5'-phosphate decarboxylase [Bacteroidales bacterium]